MKDNSNKITFIVPIYNVGKYLDTTIQSMLSQSYSNIEIILINDGSTDNSAEICQKYAEKDERIKYIFQENQGVSSARNKGIDEATGDWICFVDGDDFIENDLCSSASLYLTEDLDICFFSYNEFIMGNKKSYESPEVKRAEFGKKEFEKMQLSIFYMQGFKYTNTAAIWGKLFKTSFIKSNNLRFMENQVKSQDTLFMLYVLQFADKGVYFNRSLYNYRIIRESISRRYNSDIFSIYKQLLYQFRIFIKKYKNDEKRFIKAYEYRVFRNFMVAVTLDCCHVDNKGKYNSRKEKFLKELNSEPFCSAIKNVDINKYPTKERVLALLVKAKSFLAINYLNRLRYILRKMG